MKNLAFLDPRKKFVRRIYKSHHRTFRCLGQREFKICARCPQPYAATFASSPPSAATCASRLHHRSRWTLALLRRWFPPPFRRSIVRNHARLVGNPRVSVTGPILARRHCCSPSAIVSWPAGVSSAHHYYSFQSLAVVRLQIQTASHLFKFAQSLWKFILVGCMIVKLEDCFWFWALFSIYPADFLVHAQVTVFLVKNLWEFEQNSI